MQPLWPSCQSHGPVCQITDVSNGDTCIYPMPFSVASGRTSQGEKKLLGDLMILVISSVFHELWFIPALREHLTVRATKTYLCNVTVRVAYVVGHQTPLLLLKQQTKKCRIGTRITENNADVVPSHCAGSDLLSGLHNHAISLQLQISSCTAAVLGGEVMCPISCSERNL